MRTTPAMRLLCAALVAAPPTFAVAQRGVAPKAVPKVETVPLAAPQGVTVKAVTGGVQVAWQAVTGATQYVIERASSATTAGAVVGTVAAPALTFFDRGFNAAATYHVGAVAADGRRSVSAAVAFQPPPPPVAGATAAQTVTTGRATATPPVAPSPVGAMSIGSVTNTHPILGGYPNAYPGDTLIVTGAGFLGVTSVSLRTTGQLNASEPTAFPVATFAGTTNGFRFVVPATLPLYQAAPGTRPFTLVVSRMMDTARSSLAIGYRPPVRKITSVKMTAVLSNKGRIRINGIGFADKITFPQYAGIDNAYFGTGQMGSMTNQSVPLGNLSDTYVELWLPPTCDQEGILMLTAPRTGGTPEIILPDGVIRVACVKDPPAGAIEGSTLSADGHVDVKLGSTISIRGTNLKYVTRVHDQAGNNCPFTFAPSVGNNGFLNVTISAASKCSGILYMENNLSDPDYQAPVTSTVTGMVFVEQPPRLDGATPLWAEAGSTVTVNGVFLTYGQTPKVTVGGVPAIVTASTDRSVTFKLGAGTMSGPIGLTNEVGTSTLTGTVALPGGGTHPAFVVISGPSVVTGVSLIAGTQFVEYKVTGQNLARLGGICVKSANYPNAGYTGQMLVMKRTDFGGSSWSWASNDEMTVYYSYADYAALKGSPVQLYVQNDGPGTPPWLSQNFSCAPNSGNVTW